MRDHLTRVRPWGRRGHAAGLGIVLSAVLAGCNVVAPIEQRERIELERAWRTWEANGGPTYQFVQQRLCFCVSESTAPVTVTVMGNSVVQRRYTLDNSIVPLQWASLWGTVDDLFRTIDDALKNNAYSILATYDRKLGYPTHIAIDYRTGVADDELSITASQLTLAAPTVNAIRAP
jgi:hypothetical protein